MLWLAGLVGLTAWQWYRQRESYKKSVPGMPDQTHYAEWKGASFDRLLSRHVHYARSANAIDETRKDFDRVGWGGTGKDVPDEFEGIVRLRQWWFAGNDSDIGGSYPEAESRLSDSALQWMIEQVVEIPGGLKVGPVTINGGKMPETGDAGEPLHLFPSPDGVQHCEVAGMRDALDRRAARFPGFLCKWVAGKNWEVKQRDIDPESKVHPTVVERFALASVQQAATGAGPYRPDALEHHKLFKHYYPAPRQETEVAVQ